MKHIQFIIFLSIILGIHFLVNLYIYKRAAQGIEAYPHIIWTLRATMIFLFLSYPLGRFLEKIWYSPLSNIIHWVGAFWFAGLLYFTLSLFSSLSFAFLASLSLSFPFLYLWHSLSSLYKISPRSLRISLANYLSICQSYVILIHTRTLLSPFLSIFSFFSIFLHTLVLPFLYLPYKLSSSSLPLYLIFPCFMTLFCSFVMPLIFFFFLFLYFLFLFFTTSFPLSFIHFSFHFFTSFSFSIASFLRFLYFFSFDFVRPFLFSFNAFLLSLS